VGPLISLQTRREFREEGGGRRALIRKVTGKKSRDFLKTQRLESESTGFQRRGRGLGRGGGGTPPQDGVKSGSTSSCVERFPNWEKGGNRAAGFPCRGVLQR